MNRLAQGWKLSAEEGESWNHGIADFGLVDFRCAVEKRGTLKISVGLKKESDEKLGQWFFGEGTWSREKTNPTTMSWPVRSNRAGLGT